MKEGREVIRMSEGRRRGGGGGDGKNVTKKTIFGPVFAHTAARIAGQMRRKWKGGEEGG